MSTAPVDSFERFVTDRWPTLHRFAYTICRDAHDASDAVQEALAELCPRWASVRNPEAYVRRSIVNALNDTWSDAAHRTSQYDLTSLAAPDMATRVDDADAARALCATLPAKQRAVLVMRVLEDRSYAEIAACCGTTQATARSLVRHALAALRARLGEPDNIGASTHG